MNSNLYISDVDGCLYRESVVVRRNYRHSHMTIGSVADLKATLRAGEFTFPGGYPLHFVTDDGGSLSFETVRREFRLVADAVKRRDRTGGWRVVGCDVNWEDDSLTDAHTGERIESAYGKGA